MNRFLTLPVAPVVLVLLGPIGTQAAAVLVTDMRPRSTPPGDGAGDGEGRGGTDIVAWDRKKRRPHFTGHVRDV